MILFVKEALFKIFASISLLFSLFTFSIADTLSLSPLDQTVILDFEQRNHVPFSEFVSKVLHEKEICIEIDAPCVDTINKRNSDYLILAKGLDTFGDFEDSEKRREVVQEVSNVLATIASVTGLSPLKRAKAKDAGLFYLLFVDHLKFSKNPDEYLNQYISSDALGKSEIRKTAFLNFMKLDVNCLYWLGISDEDLIITSHIWIKSNLSDHDLKKCITEEIYNSFGVDDGFDFGSIFDWPVEVHDGRELSLVHWLVLKILYSDLISAGQAQSDTEQILKELLADTNPI